MELLEFNNLYRFYGMENKMIFALNDVSFKIKKGQFVCLLGDSGAGKSTLMNMIGCLDTPNSGNILFNGKNIFSFTPKALADYRNKALGFVFQSFNLDNCLTALENVELPLIYSEIKGRKRREMAMLALNKVGITDRAEHKPGQLSGGQKQRVAIARAIVNNPSVLLADEPTGNLDKSSSQLIMQLLKKINETGTTVIMVTHNEKQIRYCNRIIRLKNGKITDDREINGLNNDDSFSKIPLINSLPNQ